MSIHRWILVIVTDESESVCEVVFISFYFSFLSLLHQSTDMSGIALHSPPDQWPKTEQVVTAGLAYEGNPDNPSGPVTSQVATCTH